MFKSNASLVVDALLRVNLLILRQVSMEFEIKSSLIFEIDGSIDSLAQPDKFVEQLFF